MLSIGIDMPIELMRAVPERGVAAVLADHLARLRTRADTVALLIETVQHYVEKGIPVRTSRIAQVTIVADDLTTSIASYRDAFGARYVEEISSFQFGTYPDDDFFLLTVANPARVRDPGGNHVDLFQT